MDKKERKQLSPEALEKLGLAREKALQTRLRNKVLREQGTLASVEPVNEDDEPEPEPEPEKPKSKKMTPDTDDDEKEIAKPKKLKKKSNRSKIIISNDSSSSDDDDTPVVYIRTKKKSKPKSKMTTSSGRPVRDGGVEEKHEQVIQDYQNHSIQEAPPEIVRQEPIREIYEEPSIRRPNWMDW
tara:strand:- start:235 stop:783 length:549 start_codon:yes stop_codon:yes gene_type:complete